MVHGIGKPEGGCPVLRDPSMILPIAARRYGDKTALIIGEHAFSYRELDELSNRLAQALTGLGVEAGDRVSLFASNSWEWITSYYGALKAGAVINPLSAMLTPDEVAYAVNDCQARVILAPADKGLALHDIRPDTSLEHIVLFDEESSGRTGSFMGLLTRAVDHTPKRCVNPQDIATVGYTSGTTGHPKGAMQSHRSVLLNAAMYATMMVRTERDTVVTGLPCAHVYGAIIMNGVFLTGGTLVLMSRFEAETALDLITRHRATMFEGVPTMHMYMLNTARPARADLSSLTRCTTGGQTMPVSKMEETQERFGCPLLEVWGMTEIAGAGTANPFHAPNRLGSIGVPLPFMECRVADISNTSRTMPDGEDGELMVRGPMVMAGYHGNDQATRETIEPDGWLHTGDIARKDGDGYYYIVDRKKDMILTAGYNVYPAEIERVLAAHPAVALAAVGGQPDALKGEVAKAYIVLRGGAEADEAAILAHCRYHLAAYKVPCAIQFVDDVPKTSSGKIMRRELRRLDR
jgi:long-chain acyl-CoA synthetase